MFNIILDATECPIERPSDYETQKMYYSGKSKTHCVKYEVGIHYTEGFLVWISGSRPGSVHDLQVTRESGLLDMLLPNELILADKGYIGEDLFLTPIRQPESEEEWFVNAELSRVRILIEHVIGRLKVFRCLREPWRHDLHLHAVVFDVICNLVNLDFLAAPPLL